MMANNWTARGLMGIILRRQGGLCCYCQKPMKVYADAKPGKVPGNAATKEHIKPASKGGKGYHNLAAACISCNQERGSKSWLIFASVKRGEFEELNRIGFDANGDPLPFPLFAQGFGKQEWR